MYKSNQYKNICPINCPSSCTMNTTVEYGYITNISGDLDHPYTKGKLCAQGFSLREKNTHPERLKYPYYQKIKGSGDFKQITWERAFTLIVQSMLDIYQKHDSFLQLAFYKGAGNKGIHHYVTNDFFSNIGHTTKIINSSYSEINNTHLQTGRWSNPYFISEASVIIIWGNNTAATNIHLIPFLLEAKVKGSKLVVIDPVYTKTAELADLYIQITPGTDGALANLLLYEIWQNKLLDTDYLVNYTSDFDQISDFLKDVNPQEYIKKCGIEQKAVSLLLSWLKDTRAVAHLIGMGIQKHANGAQTTRTIEALAAIRGDFKNKGGGVYIWEKDELIFNNQLIGSSNNRHRLLDIKGIKHLLSSPNPIEMLWISCANPIIKDYSHVMKQFFEKIPLVVTVDQFLTPTAQMSNLILPTTTQFEELDISINSWHKEIQLNEKALTPYFKSRSEWSIMTEIARRLNDFQTRLCSFPVFDSEEEYLNFQFNDQVSEKYQVSSINDLRRKRFRKRSLKFEIMPYNFHYKEAELLDLPPKPVHEDGNKPSSENPFWLLTPQHSYRLNSQYHFFNFSEGAEAFVIINPKEAKKRNIFNGETIKVFNSQGQIKIKAVYSYIVPIDILVLSKSVEENSIHNVNDLISTDQSSILNKTPFYDTFVNVEKL